MGGFRFDFEEGILWMNLPSGRRIAYYGAKYEESKWKPGRKVLSYMGVNQQSKKWERVETWGGKLTENLVQATARDCLRESMLALDNAGYDIRAHVHDEVIIELPTTQDAEAALDNVVRIMSIVPSWAEGLPLSAAGWHGDFFTKD